MSAAERLEDAPLWAWAEQRERDLRAVEKSLAYWEAATDYYDQERMVTLFRNARDVMLAGGECPLRKASLLTIMEAIATIGSMIPRAVGPNRWSKRSPIEMVARFVGEDVHPSPAAIQASHARAADLEAMLHEAQAAAGHPVTGMTSQQHWERARVQE